MPEPKTDRTRQDESERNWVTGLVAQAQSRKFYGRIALVMENGMVRRVLKEESLLPPRAGLDAT